MDTNSTAHPWKWEELGYKKGEVFLIIIWSHLFYLIFQSLWKYQLYPSTSYEENPSHHPLPFFDCVPSASTEASSSRIGRQQTHLCAKRSPARRVPFLWKLVEFLHKLWQLISGIINFSHYNNSISSNLHNNLGDFKYFHQKSNARSEDKSFVWNVIPFHPQGATQHWIYWHCRGAWWWFRSDGYW